MADPTKPSDLSGPSPISPQIKIPPPGQQSGSTGQPPPFNLPTKEGATSPSTPTPLKPPPASVTPSPQPDLKPRPPTPPTPPTGPGFPKATPSPGPKPETAPPVGGPPVFKSSIRTMQEDIAATKKGQPPVGFQIEKESEKDIKPAAEATGPKITLPPKPTAEIKLGELEKAKPLPGAKPFSVPPVRPAPVTPPAPPKAAPGLAVPTPGGINKKRLIFLASGLVVVAFLVWFFILRGPSVPEVAVSPTPTYTATPTATPVPVESYFSIVDSVNISLGANFISRFDSSINKAALATSVGEPALYTAIDPTSGQRYTLSEFLGGLLISPPAGLVSAIHENSLYLTAIYKSDGKDGYGFIARIKEPAVALAALGNWEQTITQDIKDLFGLDPTKAVSTTFLDNTYQGVAIRYRNFPDPNLTIDYAVVTARNGENYLVIVNSREHIYSIIDKIK